MRSRMVFGWVVAVLAPSILGTSPQVMAEEGVQFQVKCDVVSFGASVTAVVPPSITLENDVVARQLITEGRDAAVRQCRVSSPSTIGVYLRRPSTPPGNPDVRASFYVTPRGSELVSYENLAKAESERAGAKRKRAEAEQKRAEKCAQPKIGEGPISVTPRVSPSGS